MRQLLSLPLFDCPEKTQRARLVFITSWATMALFTVFMALVGLVRIGPSWRALLVISFVNTLGFTVLGANRRGHVRAAGWALVVGLIGLATALALTAGGMRAQGITVFLPVVLMAGILLGEPAGTVTGMACIAIGLGLVLADRWALLPATLVYQTPFSLWLGFGLFIAMVVSLQRLATQAVRESLARAQSELAERRRAEHGLQRALRERDRALVDLGERVKELELLHATARLLQTGRRFDRDLLTELVTLLPRAWRHAECCEARIVHGGVEVTTPGFRVTPWRQSETFGSGLSWLQIDVVYLAERPRAVEGPFLAEERTLIRSLGEMLLPYADQQRATSEKARLEMQLRQTQKMEALGSLAGGIAHDFSNILTSIGGNTQLALFELSGGHPARDSVLEISKASARASDLVRRILTFSRQQETRRRPIALQPVVEEALRLLRPALPRVRIRAEFAADAPLVSADSTQMHQIVMNLGTNAGHAMDEHGGDLLVSLDLVRVQPADAAPDLLPGSYARLTLSDTGSGMTAEVLERLFEPFFTTKGPDQGSGLGLSVVRGIVAEHEGAIRVDSQVGAGTSFEIYFPAVTKLDVPALTVGPTLILGRGERFLIVDDDDTVVDLMKRALKRLGYVATGFNDPHVALRVFGAAPDAFDAVITDLAMPSMAGTEFSATVHTLRPDIPIGLMSASHESDGRPLPLGRAAIRTFIPKRCSLEELSVRLRSLLEPQDVPAD